MSLNDDIREITGINKTQRRLRIAYLFKKGQSIRSLAREFNLRFGDIEDCVRSYMASDECFEDVEDD